MSEAVLFIDGNNLYHNVKLMGIKPSLIDFVKLSEFICSFFKVKWKRTIYYNSLPSIDDGKSVYYNHMKFLKSLEKLSDKIQVKTRKLQKSSTVEIQKEKTKILDVLQLCAKCKQVVQVHCANCIGTVKKREKGIVSIQSN